MPTSTRNFTAFLSAVAAAALCQLPLASTGAAAASPATAPPSAPVAAAPIVTTAPTPPVAGTAAAAVSQARQLYRDSMAGYEAGKLEDFVAANEAILGLLPGNARALYNRACGLARLGRSAEALATLEALADSGQAMPIGEDEDLASLRAEPRFKAVEAAMTALSSVAVGQATLRAELAGVERDYVPEGVAFDSGSGSLFVGSVRHRRIDRVDVAGTASAFVTPGRDGLMGVFGLAVDAARQRLWACSSGLRELAEARPEELGKAALFAFDLASGKLAERLDLPAGRDRACNDLTLLADGRLVVSDSLAGELYLRPASGGPLQLLASGFANPNGLAVTADGSAVFVSDWSAGLYLVDLASGAQGRVNAPAGTNLIGIDGLLRSGNTLYAVQNGIRPNRVVALDLAADGKSVAAVKVLLRNDSRFDEPTLLTRVDDGLVLVANSHWNRFDRDGKLPDPATLTPPILLRLPL